MADVSPMLIKPKEAAQMLGMGESTIYKKASSGEIPSVKVGRSVRFRPAEIAKYAESLTTREPNGDASGDSDPG